MNSKELFFTIEYPGAQTKKSDLLKIIPKGKICLYFLRYGYLDYDKERECIEITDYPTAPRIDKSHFTDQEWKNANNALSEVEIRQVQPQGIPCLGNFLLCRTFLNEGFIYMINNDPNAEEAFMELEVSQDGSLEYIIEKGDRNKEYEDLRHAETTLSRRCFLIVNKNTTYWFAYSPIQWSWKYLKAMLNNKRKREERMLKIECKGIGKEEKLPIHLSSFKDVSVYFDKDDRREINFSKKLKEICIDEKAQDKSGGNELFEDMFITLHDPIGCAREISEGVCKKMLEFNAYIQALQSGETFEEAFKRLAKGIIDLPEAKTKEEKEYRELFTLALTCYQLVYNDKSSIYKYDGGSPGVHLYDLHYFQEMEYYYSTLEKGISPKLICIGNGVSGQKLEGILGIKERDELRKVLLSYRNDFGKYLTKEKFLSKHLEDILENHWERFLIGKNAMTDIIHCLSFNPYDQERHLLLQKDYVGDEKWTIWFYDLLKKEKEGKDDKLKELYNTAVSTQNIEKALTNTVDLKDALELYEKYLTYFSSVYVLENKTVFRRIRERKEFIVAQLNRRTSFNLDVWEIIDEDLCVNMQKMGIEPDPEVVKMGKYRGSNQAVKRFLTSNTPDAIEVTVANPEKTTNKNAKVAIRVREKTNISSKVAYSHLFMAKVINSAGFNSLFLLIEAYNFIFAMQEVSKDSNDKSNINVWASGAKLADAGMTLLRSTLNEKTIRTLIFRGFTATFTALSGAFSVHISAKDAINFNKKGDYDAAIAIGLSGIAFGVSTVAAVESILGIGLASGPVGWIAALAALGLAFIASALSDTELETYFKNFILSDRVDYPKLAEQSPMDYTRSFLNEKTKEKMVPDIDNYRQTMMHPLDAQATLFDMIVCGEIKFIPINPLKEYNTITLHSMAGVFSQTNIRESATHFRADMIFNRFFANADLAEVKVFFYPEGMKKTVIALDAQVTKVDKKDNSEVLSVIFGVPAEKINLVGKRSELLFTLRLCIDKGSNFYFPYPLTSKPERWLGARVDLYASNEIFYANELTQNKKTKVDTLENLKNPDLWK